MTEAELSKLLGYKTTCTVSLAVSAARKKHPCLFETTTDRFLIRNYTKEEILCICENLSPALSTLEIELIIEQCGHVEKKYISKRNEFIHGTDKFLKRVDKDERHVKTCANCIYCIKKTRAGKGMQMYPFCNFYKKFLSAMKIVKRGKEGRVNMFTDRCETWIRGDLVLIKKNRRKKGIILK